MILRSYLDKHERYAPPSPRLSDCKQMKMLMPTLKRAELHEYPKEQVLVLEGENLWFSYQVVLDEGGHNEYELKNPHNVTKLSIQFNFPTSKSVSSAIYDGGKVKVTLRTHFLTKVVNSVECKKVIIIHINCHCIHGFLFFIYLETLLSFSKANATCEAHSKSGD